MSALKYILSDFIANNPAEQAALDDLSRRIVADERFANLNPELVPENINQAFRELNGHYDANKVVERVHQLTSEQHAMIEKSMPAMNRPRTPAHAPYAGANAISSNQRMWGGIALVGAALNTFFAIDSLKHVQKTDPETGKKETQWSQVGIVTLNAALATGLAYLGTQQLRGRA